MAENKAQNTQKKYTRKKDAEQAKRTPGTENVMGEPAGNLAFCRKHRCPVLVLLVYLCHFVATSEQDMINNSYNSRQQILLSRNYRGSIYSRDGDVLAETILDADEEETRNYPYKNLFSHIVGYSTQGRMGVELWPITI